MNSSWNTGFGKIATRSAQTLLVLALLGVLIFGLTQLSLVVVPVILATILASAISPLVSIMERIKINRTTGSLIALIAFLAMIGGMGYFIVSSVRTQWSSLSSSVTEGFAQVGNWLHSGDLPVSEEQINKLINSSNQYFTSSSFGQGALHFSGTLASVFAGFLLTVVILFYFLKDGDRIFSFIVGFMQEGSREKAHQAGAKSVIVLGDYIRGTTLVALVDAILIGIGLTIMDVPLVIPLCLLVFIGAYIPYVGGTSAGAITALVALVTTDLDTAIIVAIIVLAVNQIEGNLLSPLILGNALKMSPLALLLALSVGAILGGIVGTLLAVPLVAVVWVVWTTWNPKKLEEIQEELPEVQAPDSENSEPKPEPVA
jgi:predicted PurR-regulated permease PerM